MTSEVTTAAHEMTANEMAAERTDLALRRTLMASDRSLMAWVRTGLSMISFGFTIYKILEGLKYPAESRFMQNPRTIALFLIGLGTVSLIIGVIDYRHTHKQLLPGLRFPARRPAFVVAVLMAAVGLFMFLGIFVKAL